MKITVLIENTTVRPDLDCEHGLSLYIEACGKKILFDAGQTGAFADNAQKLGIDLAAVDLAILSHGHYDHGGGLLRFLQINQTAPVYLRREAFGPHYNGVEKYIGLDLALGDHRQLRFVQGDLSLGEGLTLCAPRKETYPADSHGLKYKGSGGFVSDDFRHEQYLLIEEGGKRVCVSGCSHKGILNIMDAFRPDILVGGFHFMKMEDETLLRSAAEKLLQYDTVYYTGHCTGLKQYDFLKTILGDRLHYISTGSVLEM
jgi:7,8-dihydropterin-6-yl-methyl-4-(beta-D-ribofuranosyl)aminobenzene 5'-phosphate synthase